MLSEIAADIQVIAEFGRGAVKPRIFIWEKRRHNVSTICASWCAREGMYQIRHFSVQTDGANTYELEFHPGKMQWRLLRIYTDG